MPRDSAAADRPASYLVGTAAAFPLFFRDRTKPINQLPFSPSAKFPKSGSSCESRANGDGVFGDQSGAYNLLIQPTTGGQVNVVTIGGKGPWANSTTNVPNILIDGAHAATMQQIIINGLFAGGGNGNTGPVVDIEGGVNGPYNVLINNSIICQQGIAGSGAIALKLNAGAGSTGRWVVSGNSLGTGCIGGVGTNVTGVSLKINPGSISNGSITIANNDISNATTPISYTPN